MQETNPMILTFFHASDALMDVLKNRPLVFLQLLQTNKTLETFWRRFETNIWILLLDHLVEMESGEYMSEVYPFFVIHHIRTYGVKLASKLPIGGPVSVVHDLELGNASSRREVRYYVIYYDYLTKRFIDLLRYIHVNKTRPRFDIEKAISEYLDWPEEEDYLACLSECFVVEKPEKLFKYNLNRMRHSVITIMIQDESQNRTSLMAQQLDDILWRGYQMDGKTIDLGIKHDPPLLLDSSVAKPYRDLLFDPQQGLYKTPEEQKALFLSALGNINRSKKYMIERYGTSLECAMCRGETHFVDQALLLAFCTSDCHTQYTTSPSFL